MGDRRLARAAYRLYKWAVVIVTGSAISVRDMMGIDGDFLGQKTICDDLDIVALFLARDLLLS